MRGLPWSTLTAGGLGAPAVGGTMRCINDGEGAAQLHLHVPSIMFTWPRDCPRCWGVRGRLRAVGRAGGQGRRGAGPLRASWLITSPRWGNQGPEKGQVAPKSTARGIKHADPMEVTS